MFCPLQTLLRKKAAEELKREQERKAAERRKIISERTGQPRNIEDANEGSYTPLDTDPSSLKQTNRLFRFVHLLYAI